MTCINHGTKDIASALCAHVRLKLEETILKPGLKDTFTAVPSWILRKDKGSATSLLRQINGVMLESLSEKLVYRIPIIFCTLLNLLWHGGNRRCRVFGDHYWGGNKFEKSFERKKYCNVKSIFRSRKSSSITFRHEYNFYLIKWSQLTWESDHYCSELPLKIYDN